MRSLGWGMYGLWVAELSVWRSQWLAETFRSRMAGRVFEKVRLFLRSRGGSDPFSIVDEQHWTTPWEKTNREGEGQTLHHQPLTFMSWSVWTQRCIVFQGRRHTHTHFTHETEAVVLRKLNFKTWQTLAKTRGNARNYLEMTRLFPSVQHFQLSCAMARPFIAGDAVRVADEEELRSLVAGHANLCWSTACETMVGCHGASAAGIFTSEPYCVHHFSGWWFGTFIIFPYIGNNHPNWLIFFRGIETTNQFWRELMAEQSGLRIIRWFYNSTTD